MAKVKLGNLAPDAWPFEGQPVYLKDSPSGPIVQRRPKYTNLNSRERKWWQNQFAIAGKMASSPLWLDYLTAEQLTKGTEQVPRDLLMMAIYGKAYSIVLPDGTETTVSYKGPPPPEPPQEDDQMLITSQQWYAYDVVGTPSARAFKGAVIKPIVELKISGIICILQYDLDAAYQAVIFEDISNSQTGPIVAKTNIVATLSGRLPQRFAIDATLEANKKYGILIGRTDMAPEYPLPVRTVSDANWLGPVLADDSIAAISTDIVEGSAIISNAVKSCIPLMIEARW